MEKKNEKDDVDRNLKLIVKSSFVVFITLFLSKVLMYVYRVIIARYYNPEVYGIFSLALMIVMVFVAISSFGFSDGLLRYIPWYRGKEKHEEIKHVFWFSIIISFISSIFFGFVLFYFSDFISINLFHNPNLIIFLKIFSFLIPFYVCANIFLSVLQAFEEISWNSFILNILQNVIKVFALVLFILLGFKTNAIIWSFFFGILSMFVISYLVCKYKLPKIFEKSFLKNKAKKETRREFFSYSWPLMFLTIIGTILLWEDSFMIGYFKGVFEVGLYNAAVPIIVLLRFVPELFLKLFFPLVTKEYSHKKLGVVEKLSKQVGKWIFLFNLPLFLIIFFFPETVINILFGSEYILAANALRILSVGYFITSLVFVSNTLVSAIGKSKLFLFNVIISLILNVFLNILLIPSYGINGAAFATTITNIVASLLVFFQIKHYTSIIPLKREMIKIAVVSLIPLFLIIYFKTRVGIDIISFFLVGLFFILLYSLLILITSCLDKNDFMILRSLKRKIVDY